MTIEDAKNKVISKLSEKNMGEKKITYRLKDWGISRQRYWGCPIPVIHCENCGVCSRKKENLPVELPENVSFKNPGNPLEIASRLAKCKLSGLHKPVT